MSRIIKIQEMALQEKLSAHVAMFLYRLCNICIKAEPTALLSLEIEDDLTGAPITIEKAAVVTMPNDYYFQVYPLDHGLLRPIVKALYVSHPEFKQQYFRREDNTEVKLDDVKRKDNIYIRVTMPVINQDMHDAMTDQAKAFEKICQADLDKTYQEFLMQLPQNLSGCEEEEIDECKQMLQKSYDMHVEKKDELLKDKLKEIDEAYQQYIESHESTDKERQQRKAEEQRVITSMKFNSSDDE